jgi:hypothetical protein
MCDRIRSHHRSVAHQPRRHLWNAMTFSLSIDRHQREAQMLCGRLGVADTTNVGPPSLDSGHGTTVIALASAGVMEQGAFQLAQLLLSCVGSNTQFVDVVQRYLQSGLD